MSVIRVKRYAKVKQEQLENKLKYYQRLLNENNIVQYDPTEDYPDFEAACEKFRTTCGKISLILGQQFNGSYDDIEKHKDNELMQSAEAQKLIDELNLYNNLCIHEGNKIGLPPPQWFFKCWNIQR